MALITPQLAQQFIAEINEDAEESRRAVALRRHDMYRMHSKKFLIEQLQREFGLDSIKEMRLAPINIVRKTIDQKSSLYKKAPIRKVTNDSKSDQALVEFYTEEMDFNTSMQKANRYFNLFSNTALYFFPNAFGEIQFSVLPPYLYSIMPKMEDPTQVDTWILNAFIEAGLVTPMDDLPSATGKESFNRERGFMNSKDKVASQERDSKTTDRLYLMWSDQSVAMVNNSGEFLVKGEGTLEELTRNEIEIAPIVNLAKERDAEPWSDQGEDFFDMALALQLAYTDILTIAKHQGYAQPVITSVEEPKQKIVGINKIIWLQPKEGFPEPKMEFLAPNSPLEEYSKVANELMAMTLSSVDMNPGSISTNNMSGERALSAASRMIMMADTLEAREAQKPFLLQAEQESWEIIKRWHNLLFDQDRLPENAKALGKFSEEFGISVTYAEVKPIESKQDRIAMAKDLRNELGVISRKKTLKIIEPEIGDDEIINELKEVDEESLQRASTFGLGGSSAEVQANKQSDSENSES